VTIDVREWHDEIVFLHKIVEGGTDRSYGIQVARLAGVPRELVDRARQILLDLEEDNEGLTPRIANQGKPADLGGYYRLDPAKAEAVMRPSKTFNDALGILRH